MELIILENQVLIMKALLLQCDNNEMIKQLRDQIIFTEAMIRNFK